MSNQKTVRFNPYNRHGETAVSKRNLPHWEQSGGCYFITFRLGDSLPQSLITKLKLERRQWLEKHPKPWSEEIRSEYGQLFTKREEDWLDAGYGSCHLRSPEIRSIVINSLEKFDGDRYNMDCYILMPNHVHLIWQLRDEFLIKKELKGLKGSTARECNKHLGLSGTFWMEEYYDRLIRDTDELASFRNYIESNPSKAGLSKTEFSLQLNHRLTCN